MIGLRFGYCETCDTWGLTTRGLCRDWKCSTCAEWVLLSPRRAWWLSYCPPYRWYFVRRVWPSLEKLTYDEARKRADDARRKTERAHYRIRWEWRPLTEATGSAARVGGSGREEP